VQINQFVPDFALPDQHGRTRRLSDYRGQVVIINFCSLECPWSERADQGLAELAAQHPGGVALLTVASNPDQTGTAIDEVLHQRGLDSILLDAGGGVADLLQAQTTPHAFVIDQSGFLRYRGAVDDVTFRKRDPERFYVREAVAALLGGGLPEIQETPSYGCAIVRL
jgi:hypothetical protein